MSYLEKFAFETEKLCVFYLGGRIEGCMIEMHDVVFVVGKSYDDVAPQIKSKWIGTPKSLHVDSWYPVENVDGFKISVTKNSSRKNTHNLYFINMGSYKSNSFSEVHHMFFVVAPSKEEAFKQAKRKVPREQVIIHKDELYDMDDCIKVDAMDGYSIEVDYTGETAEPKVTNGWLRLGK